MIQIPRPKAALRFNYFRVHIRSNISSSPLAKCRRYSTPSSPSHAASRTRSRLEKFNNSLPRFLQPYTKQLINAPVRHVTAFLILHEITAIVPLFGLFGLFHYGGWIPELGSSDGDGDKSSAVDEGVRKFGKWLKKRGWVDSAAQDAAIDERGNSGGNQGVRLIVEFATAYAITKALLPIRIVGSVWATPWFARTILGPIVRTFKRATGTSKNA